MILCPKCRIQFSTSCSRCPACGDFETPSDERRIYFRKNAIEKIHAGENPQFIREQLIDDGFSDYETDEIITSAQKDLRSETRWHGFVRLIIGVPLFVCGLIVIAFALLAARNEMITGKAIIYLMGGGLAAVCFGGIACVSGLYAVFTGRESGIVPPEIL